LAPEWAELATDLKGEIKVGKLDATAHGSVAQRFGVNGYPTIKFFPAGKKTDNDAIPYEGGRSAGALAEWGR
jgi:protein disulfide-isomerase A6